MRISDWSSDVCSSDLLGAAWREVRDNRDFDKVIDMVKAINKEQMEVCCTLGMLTENQAQRLAEAGLYAYNHNLDTSEENYSTILSTRTYEDRLHTLEHVRNANINVCSGGILAMGDTEEDWRGIMHTLSSTPDQPQSLPVNPPVHAQEPPPHTHT